MISKKELYDAIKVKGLTLSTDGWLNSHIDYSEDYHENIFADTYHQMSMSVNFTMDSVTPTKMVTPELVDHRKMELVHQIQNLLYGDLYKRLITLNSAIHFGDRKTAAEVCKSIINDLEK